MTIQKLPFEIRASYPRRSARSTKSSSDRLRVLGIKYFQSEAPIIAITPDSVNPLPTSSAQVSPSVNVVITHANGFPKELYEPFIESLFQKCAIVQAVFISDVVSQGASGCLNAARLGDEYCWSDSALDLLAMIDQLRSTGQMDDSPLVGIGHSMGGCQLAHASLIHKRLFQGLILIEPIIFELSQGPWSILALAMKRRDKWPSVSQARSSFSKSPFFKTWDSAVFEKWMEHGIIPSGAGEEVTLTTTVPQEVYSFAHFVPYVESTIADTDLDASTYVYRQLKYLNLPVHFVFGANTMTFSPQIRKAQSSRVRGASHLELEGCGHLVPMEKPAVTADLCSGYIDAIYKKWTRDEEEDAKLSRRTGLDAGFKERLASLGTIMRPRL